MEFIPNLVPDGCDDFTTGYLMAAEWLSQEEIECGYDDDGEQCETREEEVTSWSTAAIESAKADCAAFQEAEAADLEIYYTESGRNEESAGHDFWLSRNGHGAGYFDRGNHEVFDRLQDAARRWSTVDVYVSDANEAELS